MRKIKEVLRLVYESQLSNRKTAEICQISRGVVRDYKTRFKAVGLSWPVGEEITDTMLEKMLFPMVERKGDDNRALQYGYLISELRKPNVTMALLFEEYQSNHPDGYKYSQFCHLLSTYRKTLNYSMRQEHKAGEKAFLDFGEGLKLIDPTTGAEIPTQLFVFVWGASNYTYVEATLGEDNASWLKANVNALEYCECCPRVEVPDNLKAAVIKACRYDPEHNPAYAEFASHYGMAIMPARPYRPKDKGKVEAGVKLAKRWILARLRNEVFYSLPAMNEAIWQLLELFNSKVMKIIGKSRLEMFETLDKQHALPLPEKRYEYADWKIARVNISYHVLFDKHNYSVPYTYIQKEVELRVTQSVVEVLFKGERICSHPRNYLAPGGYTTVKEHMPIAHQQQAYRACLGIIRLGTRYPSRLDAACKRALDYQMLSYLGVNNILKKGLDQQTQSSPAGVKPPKQHENLRGAIYYEQNLLSFN